MREIISALYFCMALLVSLGGEGWSQVWAQTPTHQTHLPSMASPSEKKSSPPSVHPLETYSLRLILPQGSQIRVGDLLEFHLNQELSFQVKEDSSLLDQGWQLDSSRKSPTSIFAIPIRSGKLTLPALLLLNEKGQEVGQTESVSVEVQSVLSPEESAAVGDAVGIIPPLSIRFPFWVIFLLGLGFMGGVALLYWIWRKRKKTIPVILTPQDPRTADEIALDELTALSGKKLLDQNLYKKYYFSLSEILKSYIATRFQVNALEATANEILTDLKKEIDLQKEDWTDLDLIFKHLDQVKFTDYVPDYSRGVQALEQVRSWVMRTKKRLTSDQPHPSRWENTTHASV